MENQKTFIKSLETSNGVLLRYRQNDKIHLEEIPFQNYVFVKKDDFRKIAQKIKYYSDKATTYHAKNGEFVKIYLKDNFNRYYMKRNIESMGVETFEGDISASKRYMIDYGDKYDFKNFKVLWLDFETDDRGTFDKDDRGNVVAGKKQILSCAIENENEDKWYFSNENPDDEKADSEYKMILDILQVLMKYDVVAAWNGQGFDFPYLRQRMDFHEQTRNINFNDVFNLKLINKIDELEKYKKYDWNKHDSYSLENVSRDELDDGKIDFSDDVSAGKGRFYQLFKENPAKFKEYNMKDVTLMKRLDDKLRFYKTHKATCDVTKCTAEEAMFVSQLADGGLLRLNHKKNYICKSKPNNEELDYRQTIHIGGGFIAAKPGLYHDVHLFDFKSHYPLVMMTFNISQETFVKSMPVDLFEIAEQFSKEEFGFMKLVQDEVDGKELVKFIKEHSLNPKDIMWKFIDLYSGDKAKRYSKQHDLVWTPADFNCDGGKWKFHPHRFYSKEYGSLPQYVFDAMTERDKGKYYIAQKIKENKDFKKTSEHEVLKLQDIALKIIANGAYGFTGLKSSRFFDYHVADAITTTARWIIKKTMLFSEKQGLKVVYNHTDSCYVINESFKEEISTLKFKYYDFYQNELFKDFAKHKKFKFKNAHTGELEEHDYYCIFEQDSSIDAMIPTGNARYYKLSNGKVSSVGGAMRKNDTNKLAAELQEKICYDIMTKTIDLDKWLLDLQTWKDTCFGNKLELKHLVFQKQYSRHYSTFGQPMMDSFGVQKKTKDGKLRFAPIPVQAKLVKRMVEDMNSKLEVGDMIKYIIGKPQLTDYVSNSRKKVERQQFLDLKSFATDEKLSLVQFKELLDGNNCLYRECHESTQRGITIEEYQNGDEYDSAKYWDRIITPVVEIMKTVYPRECIEKFGHIWNMTEKQIEKSLDKLDLDED